MLMKVRNDNEDDTTNLKNETKKNQKIIEETIGKVVNGIKSIDDKIQLLNLKERESEERVRKCLYYNKGFCKLQKNCPFFHPENLCPQFEKEGICLKTICRDRHQTLCRYWQKGNCYRGESCQFSDICSKKTLMLISRNNVISGKVKLIILTIASFVVKTSLPNAQLSKHIKNTTVNLQT